MNQVRAQENRRQRIVDRTNGKLLFTDLVHYQCCTYVSNELIVMRFLCDVCVLWFQNLWV